MLAVFVIVGLIVLGLVTSATVAASTDETNLTVGTTAAEVSTQHLWEVTAGGDTGDDIEYIYLNYSNTGTNVSNIVDTDTVAVYGSGVEVVGVTAESGDEILNITVSQSMGSFETDDTVTVDVHQPLVVNPPAGAYAPTIELYNDTGEAFVSAGDTLEITESDITATQPSNDIVTDHVLSYSITDTAGQLDEIRLNYSDATFSTDHVAYTSEWNGIIGDEHTGGQVAVDGDVVVLEFWEPQPVEYGDDVVIELRDGVLNPEPGTHDVTVEFYDAQAGLVNDTTALLEITEGKYVNGTITDTKGKAIADVSITARNESRIDWRIDNVIDQTTTDENGHYSLFLPGGGVVDVIETEKRFYNDVTNTSANDHLGSDDFDFELESRAIITGTLTDTNGVPIRHDGVEIRNDSIGEFIFAGTDENGVFAEEIDPDIGPIDITSQPELHKSNESIENVAIEGGETTTQDVIVEPDYEVVTVEGTITSRTTADGVVDGTVRAINETNPNLVYENQTDENGDYTIQVPKGFTTIETSIGGYADNETSIEAPVSDADLIVDPIGHLEGTVTTSGGDPIENAFVNVMHPFTGSHWYDETDADGTYSVDVTGGTDAYDVHIDHANDEYVDEFERNVIIEDGRTSEKDFELASPSYITGTVENESSGNPIPGARIETWDSTFTTFENTVSDPDGTFELRVSPGTYDLLAGDSAVDVPAVGNKYIDGIDVGVQETTDIGAIELEAPSFIEGQVVDSNGDPAENAIVIADNGDRVEFDFTDYNGEYRIDAIAGEYSVIAFGENETAAVERIDLHPGETVSNVDFEFSMTEVKHRSIEIIDGPGDDSELGVSAKVEGGVMPIQVYNTSEGTAGGLPVDIEDTGVSADTKFRIELTVTNYTPTTLMWGANEVDWTTSQNDSVTDGTDISINASPINLQIVDPMSGGVPVGPLIGQAPHQVEWPSKEDDQADFGFNKTLYFGVSDMAMAPPELSDRYEGMTVTTNAQTFEPPSVDDDSLKLWVAGPNRTVEGDEHEGFYQAFIPDSTLEDWGVENPLDELETLYQGNPADFDVTEVDGGAWIELLDISYSAGYVEIEPSITEDEEDEDEEDEDEENDDGGSSGGSSGSSGGSSSSSPSDDDGNVEDEDEEEDGIEAEDEDEDEEDDEGQGEGEEEDGIGAEDEDEEDSQGAVDAADLAGDESTDDDDRAETESADETPGFGIGATVATLLAIGAWLRRQ